MSQAAQRIGVCGAGAMGSGIAQIAAQHGATVTLYDVSREALDAAGTRMATAIDGLASKGKIEADVATSAKARISLCSDLEELADCELVIEAIVEDAGAKADLFARLEQILSPTAVIASNTSSLPIARLARTLRDPSRFVGMHFFNPPTVMKLVEVVGGPASDAEASAKIDATALAWGKVAVRVADVPGFIVNRVARPFYAEAFQALQEDVAKPDEIDALFTTAGFRMGPLELADFIGQDVNFTVARSIHESYFGKTRFIPQLRQAALVDAGWLGRKTGRGIYDYSRSDASSREVGLAADIDISQDHRRVAEQLRWSTPGSAVSCGDVDIAIGCGATARSCAAARGRPVALLDWFGEDPTGAIGYAVSDDTAAYAAMGVVAALGALAVKLSDRPGLIVCRTLAQIANAAADAVFDGVADEAGIDAALRYGANYPFGPFEWADRFGRDGVSRALTAIAQETSDAMYAPSQYWGLAG